MPQTPEPQLGNLEPTDRPQDLASVGVHPFPEALGPRTLPTVPSFSSTGPTQVDHLTIAGTPAFRTKQNPTSNKNHIRRMNVGNPSIDTGAVTLVESLSITRTLSTNFATKPVIDLLDLMSSEFISTS